LCEQHLDVNVLNLNLGTDGKLINLLDTIFSPRHSEPFIHHHATYAKINWKQDIHQHKQHLELPAPFVYSANKAS